MQILCVLNFNWHISYCKLKLTKEVNFHTATAIWMYWYQYMSFSKLVSKIGGEEKRAWEYRSCAKDKAVTRKDTAKYGWTPYGIYTM